MDRPEGPSGPHQLQTIHNCLLIVQRHIMPCCHGSVSVRQFAVVHQVSIADISKATLI